jgi:hypothetical protein
MPRMMGRPVAVLRFATLRATYPLAAPDAVTVRCLTASLAMANEGQLASNSKAVKAIWHIATLRHSAEGAFA